MPTCTNCHANNPPLFIEYLGRHFCNDVCQQSFIDNLNKKINIQECITTNIQERITKISRDSPVKQPETTLDSISIHIFYEFIHPEILKPLRDMGATIDHCLKPCFFPGKTEHSPEIMDIMQTNVKVFFTSDNLHILDKCLEIFEDNDCHITHRFHDRIILEYIPDIQKWVNIIYDNDLRSYTLKLHPFQTNHQRKSFPGPIPLKKRIDYLHKLYSFTLNVYNFIPDTIRILNEVLNWIPKLLYSPLESPPELVETAWDLSMNLGVLGFSTYWKFSKN